MYPSGDDRLVPPSPVPDLKGVRKSAFKIRESADCWRS